MPSFSDHLRTLGLDVLTPSSPIAAYVPFVRTGNLVVISGQLPLRDGVVTCVGKLGDNVTLEEGYAAAHVCGLNLLAHLGRALDDDLSRVVRCVRLGGFVASTPAFTDHPKVINGASELMVTVFGEAGRHARAAVGVPVLPLDAAVEVEGWFELKV